MLNSVIYCVFSTVVRTYWVPFDKGMHSSRLSVFGGRWKVKFTAFIDFKIQLRGVIRASFSLISYVLSNPMTSRRRRVFGKQWTQARAMQSITYLHMGDAPRAFKCEKTIRLKLKTRRSTWDSNPHTLYANNTRHLHLTSQCQGPGGTFLRSYFIYRLSF